MGHRRRIHHLVPTPTVTAEVEAKLSEFPPGPLVEVVLDAAEPWWRRRPCAAALAGRVDDVSAGRLLACVERRLEIAEVRIKLLQVLATPGRAHSSRLLAWLKEEEKIEQPSHQLDMAMLQARGALGDVSAFTALSELAADAWPYRRRAGEAALDALIQQCGERVLLESFGAKAVEALAFQQQRPMAARLLGVRLVHRAGGDVMAALADASVVVAHFAATLLVAQDHDAELWQRVHARAPGHLWALVVLQRRGADIRAEWIALGSPRVELPGVPADVREAIIRYHSPGERETDPRWILETALLEPRAALDEAAMLSRVEHELRASGLRPEPAISAGDEHEQGFGTYFTIRTAEGPVEVSTLGSFFSAEGPAVNVMRDAGFRHIDAALGATIFEGLPVYFFGHRDPLAVQDLLFYWQD